MLDLTKWPRLLVTGEPVTEQQANDILIRTASDYLHVNDREWNRTVARILGFSTDEDGYPDFSDTVDTRERLRKIELGYLNNDRIASSWIGGPHGWCNWDGTIGCSNYNIGKWPEQEEVTADWELIAAAFPYLDLTAQLVTDEGDGQPAGEWRVLNGTVEYREPTALLVTPKSLDEMGFMTRLFSPGGERGVSEERLIAAVAQVQAGVA